MFRTIYYIIAIIFFSGCLNKNVKSGDRVNTASIADINKSIRVDFSKGIQNKVLYQPLGSFVDDSSVHIILGFLFSSTSSKMYMLRTIHFNGYSNVFKDISKESYDSKHGWLHLPRRYDHN